MDQTGILHKNRMKQKHMLDEILPQCLDRTGRLNVRTTNRATLMHLSELMKNVADTMEYKDDVLMKEVNRIRKQPHFIYFGKHAVSGCFYFFKALTRTHDAGGCYCLRRNGRLDYASQPIVAGTLKQLSGGDTKMMFPPAVQGLILEDGNRLLGYGKDGAYYFEQRQFNGDGQFKDVVCRLEIDEVDIDRVESGTNTVTCNFRAVAVRMQKFIRRLAENGNLGRGALPYSIPATTKDEKLAEIIPGKRGTVGINA